MTHGARFCWSFAIILCSQAWRCAAPPSASECRSGCERMHGLLLADALERQVRDPAAAARVRAALAPPFTELDEQCVHACLREADRTLIACLREAPDIAALMACGGRATTARVVRHPPTPAPPHAP